MIITKYFHAQNTIQVDAVINEYLLDGYFVSFSDLHYLQKATQDFRDGILVYGIITFEKP